MSDARVVRLDETETVSFGPLAHYNPILGAGPDDPEPFPIRTGIQTSAPGYVAATHSHPYIEVLHILDGEAEAWLDGQEDRKVHLKPGDTIVLPAGVLHSFRTVGDKPMRLLGTHLSPKRVVDYKEGRSDARGYRVLDTAPA